MGRRVNWQQLVTPGGDPNAEYRARYSILGAGRFPVAPGDCERAEAALRLRGQDTTPRERERIIRAVADRCPELSSAAQQALEDDRAKGLI